MSSHVTIASKSEVRQVIELMMNGVTSDPQSMEELTTSWWRRLVFSRWVGPRLLQNQMDTFVIKDGDQIGAYLVVQYSGETAGTFDWALLGPTPEERIEQLAALLDEALDHVEENKLLPYFYFGIATPAPEDIQEVLEEIGLERIDYQLAQMRSSLPLEEMESSETLRLMPRLSSRFRTNTPHQIAHEYPDRPELAAVVETLHAVTLRSSKILSIQEEETMVGFVQQFKWRKEMRLLLALEPRLWGTEEERRILATAVRLVGGRFESVRLRTFSSAHLSASQSSFESMGFRLEEAPWERWIVALGDEEEEVGEDEA